MNYSKLITAFFIISFLFLSSQLFSQDLLVTKEGDSLNCKITNIKNNNIFFTYVQGQDIRNTLLPEDQVKYYQYDFFSKTIVLVNKVKGNKKYPHFRAALTGGWSYRTARVADNTSSFYEDYVKKLKTGYHYGLDLTWYFSESWGVGWKYSRFHAQNKEENVYVEMENNTYMTGTMSDNINITFNGPELSTRSFSRNKKNCFVSGLAIGYFSYKNKAVLIYDYKITGGDLGMYLDLGYDIGISKNFAIGIQLSYMLCTLKEFELSDGNKTILIKLPKGSYESLARFDLSVGLRFNR